MEPVQYAVENAPPHSPKWQDEEETHAGEAHIEDLERWEKGEVSALWRDAQAQVLRIPFSGNLAFKNKNPSRSGQSHF